ncbi:hypothetical protein V0R48_21655 [Pseudomonas alcaligenes]|uniref:hypothetical protein n=1 Tax=Aquipseudomonas alcaligenes TaxID=43263 RepID=UPI002E7BF11E|nr:hypothetical protein [Pseudomonas alcaligenes]MEE1951582.1 hypothetical protein [Pseudomonas alcaligenes]
MDIAVFVQDCTLNGSLLNSLTLPVPTFNLTARELIQRYVHQVAEERKSTPSPSRYNLFTPASEEALLNGYDQPEERKIDVQRQCQYALRAFESNRFLILVDDRQIEQLDESFSITSFSSIQFLRLVPLVGG